MIDKNYFQLIDNVIDCFMNQENIDQLQLVFINLTLIKMNELNEKINFQYNNIYMLDLENPNEYIKNLNTEYILMVNLNDKYKTNYSTFCMKYLDDHLNNDVKETRSLNVYLSWYFKQKLFSILRHQKSFLWAVLSSK